ncbi:hypothetical protein 7841G3A2_13 [Haloquadratum phage sp.]|nr:hypothetical protein 7841G3A2_13 [Haloquadratum phage sp.]
MTVRIQSGTTVFINSGQTVQTPQVQNAGTITNAGTTQQFRSNVASGSGSGLGTAQAQEKRLKTASGFGEGFGQSSVITAEFIKSGQTVDIDRVIRDGFDDIQNAGTLTNAGATIDIKQDKIALPAATNGRGLLFGQATAQEKRLKQAAGFGEGFGQATKQFRRLPVASGIGQLLGQATTSRLTDRQASGIGQGIGTAIERPLRPPTASGFGEMLGTARKPIPFDPIQQIVNLINKTNDSRWRYGKPERIAPIWEYSHNDRINFPNAAFYIYTPAESTVDKFGIEGESFNQTITIEILIMTLEATETQGYVGDTAEFITQLYNDNTQNTVQFHRFGNITASDLRNEHMGQQTDHYLASVTFEIQRFDAIRDLESVGAFR